jgi:uncharacterized protein involved in exopolysaccharide biosynthesis
MTIALDTESQTHLKVYLTILRQHPWLITGIFLVTVITASIWTFLQIPIFQAAATVLIDPDSPRVLPQSITEVESTGGIDYHNTQYELIKSRTVVERVIKTQNLNERIPRLGAARDPYLALLGSLTVEPKRNTRLVLVKFEHPDPHVAAEVANAVAKGYVKFNLDIKLKGSRDALAWLNQEMAQLRNKVQESSDAMQNYRVKASIFGLREQRTITTAKIMDFNRAYLEAQAQRLSIEAKLRELTQIAKDKSGAQTIFTVADSGMIQTLKKEASDLEIQKSRLLKTYKEKHPEILKVEAQFQQVTQRIDSEIQTMLRAIQTEYRVAKAKEETLLNYVNQLKLEAQDVDKKEIQAQVLQRDLDSNQQLYEAMLKHLKETGVTGGLETNNVRVAEEAVIPNSPVRPNKTQNLGIGILIGAVAGIGVALAVEYFDQTIKSPNDVERYLGLPVIGTVPLFGDKH